MVKVKYMKGEITVALILAGVVVAIIVGIAAPLITKKPDSPVEQAAEAYLKNETGLVIDFTPDDPKPGNLATEPTTTGNLVTK